jgi:hypothetical protein
MISTLAMTLPPSLIRTAAHYDHVSHTPALMQACFLIGLCNKPTEIQPCATTNAVESAVP